MQLPECVPIIYHLYVYYHLPTLATLTTMDQTDSSRLVDDLSDYINVNDDLTDENFFSIEKTKYYEFDKLDNISQKWDFKNNLTILSLNIRSLPNKVSKLTNLLSQVSLLPSIISLQEIWGSRGNFSLEGYSKLEYYSRDSLDTPNPNCGGGGWYIHKKRY